MTSDPARQLQDDLRGALDRSELALHYQPLVNLRSGKITGFEALLRWNHPDLGFIPPTQFIPLAETQGTIVPIGRWVLREACRQAAEWQTTFNTHVGMNVNVSPSQLAEPSLVEDVRSALAFSHIEPASLTIEITETAQMSDADEAVVQLEQLKELGVQLAIDDFGTGYSSLSYLRRFPFDLLKIDRSFVSGIAGTDEESAVARAALRLGQELGLAVAAEGIEHASELRELRRLDCTTGQGFLFSKPLSPADARRLLAEGTVYERAHDSPRRVLVVNDDPVIRDAVTHELARAAFAVTDSTAALAIESVKTMHPDLIVLDVALPGATGTSVCKLVKSAPSTPPSVLCISGVPKDRIKWLEAGADAFLPRAAGVAELVARVRMLLRTRGGQRAPARA